MVQCYFVHHSPTQTGLRTERKEKNCEEDEADVTTSQKTPSVSSTKTYGIMLFTETLLFVSKSHKTHKYALWTECSFSLLKPAIRTGCFKG